MILLLPSRRGRTIFPSQDMNSMKGFLRHNLCRHGFRIRERYKYIYTQREREGLTKDMFRGEKNASFYRQPIYEQWYGVGSMPQ